MHRRKENRFSPATSGNYNVLLIINHIGSRCGITTCRQLVFPQEFSVLLIEYAEFFVTGSPDHKQTTRGGHGAAKVWGASGRNTF